MMLIDQSATADIVSLGFAKKCIFSPEGNESGKLSHLFNKHILSKYSSLLKINLYSFKSFFFLITVCIYKNSTNTKEILCLSTILIDTY